MPCCSSYLCHLVNCRVTLERSLNNYDYLVDEGTKCNATSDLLLEHNRELSIVDLLFPSLVLLITLLQKLQEVKEQHRNTKLMNALLRIHKEIRPKLAACAAELSSPYSDYAIGYGVACHLIASSFAFWSIYGWSPGLYHNLLASVQSASLLTQDPAATQHKNQMPKTHPIFVLVSYSGESFLTNGEVFEMKRNWERDHKLE